MPDCRKCIYFIPYSQAVNNPEKYGDIAETLLILRENGLTVLGWCTIRNNIVRYYTSKCRYYKPRQTTSKKLTKYLVGGIR